MTEVTRKTVSNFPVCFREKIQTIVDDPKSFWKFYDQHKNTSPEIIPGAAYIVYDSQPRITDPITKLNGPVPLSSRYAIFYSSKGEPLEVVPYTSGSLIPQKMIDPNAEPIKVESYRRICLHKDMRKRSPNYCVLFYDRNGNRIGREIIDDTITNFRFPEKYNLSEAVAEPDDFSLKPTEFVDRNVCIVC